MDNKIGQLLPAPEIPAAELVAWIYHPQTAVKITGPQHQILQLPEPWQLLALLEMAILQHNCWALLDGPRAQRTDWLLDIWWEEQPEMPSRLLEKTQARSVNLAALSDAIAEYIQS